MTPWTMQRQGSASRRHDGGEGCHRRCSPEVPVDLDIAPEAGAASPGALLSVASLGLASSRLMGWTPRIRVEQLLSAAQSLTKEPQPGTTVISPSFRSRARTLPAVVRAIPNS